LDAWGFCAAGNIPSYRDRRIKGFGPLLRGLLSFYALCLVDAVWNYAASSVFTWRHPQIVAKKR
jgi:hypothetical protein